MLCVMCFFAGRCRCRRKRGLDDNVDSEVARALLRGKHGVEDDPHRTVSPTDVTADVYAAA